jgi:hypothetical protein
VIKIGDKILRGNPEDIMSLRILEVNDVYEVGPNETYFEIFEYDVICRRSREKPGL